jgi:hypothetical protein
MGCAWGSSGIVNGLANLVASEGWCTHNGTSMKTIPLVPPCFSTFQLNGHDSGLYEVAGFASDIVDQAGCQWQIYCVTVNVCWLMAVPPWV